MRVLVTGGTGYLGSAIVRSLAREGHTPVIYARHATPSNGVDAIAGDIRDAASVRAAVGGVDAVCHVAALVSLWRPRAADFDDVNVDGVRHVLHACRDAGLARIVYTSSFLAYPPGDADVTRAHEQRRAIDANDYQRTKRLARDVVRRAIDAGAPVVTIVPGVVYGPGPATEGNLIGGLVRDHLAGRLPGLIGGGRTWSYAYVDDVAGAHVKALTRGDVGREYIAGGENAPQVRVFEIVRALTGRPLPRRLPYSLAAVAGAMYEARARLTGAAPLVTRGAVEIFRHDWPLDSSDAEAALDYRPTPLADGVGAVVSALRAGAGV